LRFALGVTLLAQGVAYAMDWHRLGVVTWTIGLFALTSSVAILIGYLTPFTGVLAGMTSVGTGLSWFRRQIQTYSIPDWQPPRPMVIAAAIVCLGPGAFSLDARLFGRREIVIPNASPSPKS
jgi:uncharacterized membrane protein YphA (DoxX/SURF4 family)